VTGDCEACPRCGEAAGIPIFYGMPAGPPDELIFVAEDVRSRFHLAPMFEGNIHVYRTEQGESASGGCVPSAERWRCKHCGHAW
jgi:hypothetical protein